MIKDFLTVDPVQKYHSTAKSAFVAYKDERDHLGRIK
jgi:hypothetical protein